MNVGASTALQILKEFARFVVVEFDDKLDFPAFSQCLFIERMMRLRGFQRCLGSIDCTHWYWENCPKNYEGIYRGKSGRKSMVLEGIYDYRGRVIHAFWHSWI